jgi:mannosyltransferase
MTITWVAFLLRTVNLAGQSLWRDEVDAIRFSNWPLPELVAGLFQEGHNGPLFFLGLRFWRNVTGNSEFALRYPSALLGALAVPLGFVLARRFGFSRRVALLLGLLLATSPYLVWYGQEAKMYALLLALVALAFIAYLKALTSSPTLPLKGEGSRSWVWWLVFVVATTLSFYTHILAPLMLVVYGLVAWLHPGEWRRHWRGWFISMACLTLPYLPLAVWQAPLWWNSFQSGHPFYSLDKQIYTLLQLYSSGLVRFFGLTAIILFVFLWLCGLLLPRPPANYARRSTSRASVRSLSLGRLILAGWTLLPLLIVYLISLRVAVFEDRYLIYIVPGFYLLVAVGLVLVRRYSRLLAGLCLGLLLAINLLGIWHQQRQPIKADFRAVAAYLANHHQPTSPVMLQMPYLRYTLRYYYPGKYNILEGLWTNNGKPEAQVDAEMAALTTDLSDLWLVVSEEDAWDNRRLTRAWLDTHARLVDQAHFTRVDVYHYQFRPGVIETQSIGPEVK